MNDTDVIAHMLGDDARVDPIDVASACDERIACASVGICANRDGGDG